MEKLNSSYESEQKTNNKYIIAVKLEDLSTIYPTYVSDKDINFKEKLKDATDLFASRYRNKWVVETIIDENIIKSNNINSWDSVKKEILENESNDKVWNLLKELNNLWVSPWFIDVMRKDLQVEDNIKFLETYLELSDFSESDKKQTLLAMEIAIKAHEWQVQKRKKDKEWLDNIPYSNHPIQVAVMAIRDLKMSAEEVQASLLHDVVEDTKTKENKLREIFSDEVIDMVLDCSKNESETREEFMERMKLLKWSSKVIKCLDRLHNMIRAFSVKDPTYINRCLVETKEVYLPAFEKIKELKPLKIFFFEVLEELEKYYEKIA